MSGRPGYVYARSKDWAFQVDFWDGENHAGRTICRGLELAESMLIAEALNKFGPRSLKELDRLLAELSLKATRPAEVHAEVPIEEMQKRLVGLESGFAVLLAELLLRSPSIEIRVAVQRAEAAYKGNL